ncbi:MULTISPECIES: PBSX family phage terminase large subunit [Pelosinus]|uniref:Phage terminase, large subunit, PBSX family n=1 Tax=Pelosinus fermentans B4 TaxID=1149862 RepID=I8RKI0_9FIRM|nr:MULTISPECIES: PBSX family phage terminase large subunit [Pelosinus]EIW20723.1 phage terminase, large subunit, PBSX family [Pelosinus fermentans B4]EIW25432.1 phage terminase, large subunit, PBSX family [Pelosinus fermentans A11]OAM93692.1 phage terminase, large subunit, PBSX family [Pelosinus fermentans DSM 17108]SDQ86774.1 phage terminase, large subunit, PBSX family [Pelosinus fermentans]
MKRNKVTPFNFEPFSTKQLQVMTWWLPNSPVRHYDMIIADGSVRSGKTISMSLSYVQWSMESFNGENIGMAGKTIGSFRRNVLAPLKRMLKALKYRVKDHRSDNMVEISKGGKTNYFYIFGGKDERSQDLIQGITLAGMLFDEVALMPESFVNQATARCSVKGSKLWFNCNPAGPYHWFKTDYIEKADDKKAICLHFTMDDNLSLDVATKDRYKRMYSGVFYKRYILGLWVMAAGAIYDMFEESKHVIEIIPKAFDQFWVSSDYGTGNATVFLLQARRGKEYYTLREYYYDSRKVGKQKTDAEYSADLKKFLEDCKDIIGNRKIPIIVDPSAASFIAQLKKDGFSVKKAHNAVIDGIRYVATLLSELKYFIHKSCTNTIREKSAYIWDEKAQDKGEDKPIKQNDHASDSERYGLYTNRNTGKIQVC